MAAQVDFWGDIGPAIVKTPVSIMREQAALLGQKTQNLVEARVDSAVSGLSLVHSFNLVVPSLDHYTYELFRVWHSASLYPVTVPREHDFGSMLGFTGEGRDELQTEAQFLDWLHKRLSSAETKKLIGNLLAQVNS